MQSDEKHTLANKLAQMLGSCTTAVGSDSGNMLQDAYNYYFQRPRGDEVAGRSQIVSGDVSSMVEANLAEMVEPFLDKRLAEFVPMSAEDAEQARYESECVNEMLFKRQPGFIELATAVKDALLVRNAVVKVCVEKRTHSKRIRKSNVDPIALTAILDQLGEVTLHKFDPENKELSATVKKETRNFVAYALEPENFFIPCEWNRQDLQGISFCAERHVEPRSTLVERGFDKDLVAALTRVTVDFGSNGSSAARRPRSSSNINFAVDSSQELVEWFECYCMMDDGNGASELRRISLGDKKIILEDEPADEICYATGVAIINPHVHSGISLFDKLKGTQDQSTALNRALMDNLNAVTKQRTAHLDGVVEEDDLTDGRVNGSIRVNGKLCSDVRQAITGFEVPDASGNILANIEHQRRVRSEMAGASLDMATGQMQLNDRLGSQGLDRAYSVMERLARFMMRTIANTLVRNMFLRAHEALRTQWVDKISFQSGNKWVTVTPSEWQVRESVSVNIGKASGERARIATVLEKLMDRMTMLAQNGMEGILVDATGFYNAMIEWLTINDIDIPERFAIDPRSDAAVKAMTQKNQATQKERAIQAQLAQQAIALEQLRTALDKYKTDAELQYKYYDTVLNAQIEEAKLAVTGVVDLANARKKAQEAKENGSKAASKTDGNESRAAKNGDGQSGSSDDSAMASS